MFIRESELRESIKKIILELEKSTFDTASAASSIGSGDVGTNKKGVDDTLKEVISKAKIPQSISDLNSDGFLVSRSLDWGELENMRKAAWCYLFPYFHDIAVEMRGCGYTDEASKESHYFIIQGSAETLKQRLDLIKNSSVKEKVKILPFGTDKDKNSTIGKIKGTAAEALFLRFTISEEYDSKFFDIYKDEKEDSDK